MSISLAPDIESIASASTTATSTVITWSTPNQFSSTQVAFGTTTAYGATSTGNAALDHTVTITGLAPATTYHFAVSSEDGFGTSESSDETVATTAAAATSSSRSAGPAPLKITDISVIPTYSVATISWTTGIPTNAAVIYGATSAYSASSTGYAALAPSFSTDHSVSISGLTPDTTYHFAIVSQDSSGEVSISPDQVLTTSSLLL